MGKELQKAAGMGQGWLRSLFLGGWMVGRNIRRRSYLLESYRLFKNCGASRDFRDGFSSPGVG